MARAAGPESPGAWPRLDAAVGGTWHENRDSGARVDTPSRLYSHVFAADYGYPYSLTGIETGSGEQRAVDAIVFATGFKATEYLFPMEITDRDGMTVEELWAETGVQACVGAMIPGRPNLFTLYGPNRNGGLLVPAFQEMETVFALRCIERLVLDGRKSVDVKVDAYRRCNERIDACNGQMAWRDPRAQNDDWTKFDRSATQDPLTPLEMWSLLPEPDFGDLELR